MICDVPFEYLAHLLTVPVMVGDVEARFIVDTGIGPNLISPALAARVGCLPDGSAFTGRRMSGQELTLPLASVESLTLGTSRAENVPVGIFDMQAMAGLDGIGGFLSLSYFRAVPATVDYAAGRMVLEDEASLARRAADGTAVTVGVRYEGCSTSLMLGLDLPGGGHAKAEVDTGSDTLILNTELAAAAGIDLNAHDVERVDGTDETGHEFARYFTTLPGAVAVSGAPAIRISGPRVMFQEIIYDGLVGDAFLRNYAVTYDLPNKRMIFGSA